MTDWLCDECGAIRPCDCVCGRQRERLRAHLDRAPPRGCDVCNDGYVVMWVDGLKQLHRCVVCASRDWRESWRDFEPAPCVCRGGHNVVPCVGGFRLERCARCNAATTCPCAGRRPCLACEPSGAPDATQLKLR